MLPICNYLKNPYDTSGFFRSSSKSAVLHQAVKLKRKIVVVEKSLSRKSLIVESDFVEVLIVATAIWQPLYLFPPFAKWEGRFVTGYKKSHMLNH